MNFFRSEEHVEAWLAEYPALSKEILSFDLACEWINLIGKGRLREDYVHPRATGELGPLMKSLGIAGEFWKPPA